MAQNKRKSPVNIVKVPDYIVWIFALTSFVIVPATYFNRVIDVSLMPKFIVIISLLVVFYLYALFNKKAGLPETGLLFSLPVIFWISLIIISIISLFAAINPSEGIFDISKSVIFLLFLLAAASILIKTNNLRPFIISAFIITVIYLIVGFYEYFIFVFRHTEADSLYKVNGIKSHKNVFAGTLYLFIPLLIYEIIIADINRKILPSILVFLNILLLILIQTRSVWIALICNIVVCSGFFIIFRKKILSNAKRKNLTRGMLYLGSIIAMAFIVSFLITNYSVNHPYRKGVIQAQTMKRAEKKDAGKVSEIDERVASIFNPQSENRQRRLEIWKFTLKMVKDHPFTGVGAGNWKIIIPAYYSDNYISHYFHNWRRPHNDYIWVLAEKGIFGLAAYVGFFFFLLVYSIKILRSNANTSDKIFIIAMIAGLAGYCVDACFSFPYERIEQQTLMIFMAAGIIWKHHQIFHTSGKRKLIKPYSFSLMALLMTVIAFILTRIWLISEVDTKLANACLERGYYQDVVYYIDKAYSPVATIDPRNGPVLWFRGKANMAVNNLPQAKEDFERAMIHNPYSVLVECDLGAVYGMMGDHEKAVEILKKLTDKFPNYHDAMFNLGVAYYHLGKYHEALDCLYKCKRKEKNERLDYFINEILDKVYGKDRIKLE